MKAKIPVFILAVSMLFVQGAINASSNGHPAEVVSLKMIQGKTWREISRAITDQQGIFECIPQEQNAQNWSELICFQYSNLEESSAFESIEEVVDNIGKTVIRCNPGSKITWKILEKNKNDQIYEWILHEPHNRTPVEHEIARAFLTNKVFHRIGFTCKNKEISSEEREKWIKTLQTSVAIVPYEEALSRSQLLSILDGCKDLFDFGPAFQDWKILTTFAQEGGTLTCRVPPTYQINTYVDECMEVFMCPVRKIVTIEQLFEMSKKMSQKKSAKEIKSTIYRQSLNEIVCSYSYLRDQLYVTIIEKLWITGNQHYLLRYTRGLPSEPSMKQILQWKDQLDAIKMRPQNELHIVPKAWHPT